MARVSVLYTDGRGFKSRPGLLGGKMISLSDIAKNMTVEDLQNLSVPYRDELDHVVTEMIINAPIEEIPEMLLDIVASAFAIGRRLEMINVIPPQTRERIPCDN